MTWSNGKMPRARRVPRELNELGSSKSMYTHPDAMSAVVLPPEPSSSEEVTITPPVVVDPRTGQIEKLGKGRIAIIGAAGVERLVTLPKSEDLIDVLTAADELNFSA